MIQSFDTRCLCVVLSVKQARASFHLFCLLFIHLSISVLWAVCVLVSTLPPLSLIFWNFNFWRRFKRMNPVKQETGTLTNEYRCAYCTNNLTFLTQTDRQNWSVPKDGFSISDVYFTFVLCFLLFQGHCRSVLPTSRMWGRGKSSAQPSPLLEAADLPASCYTSEKHRAQW